MTNVIDKDFITNSRQKLVDEAKHLYAIYKEEAEKCLQVISLFSGEPSESKKYIATSTNGTAHQPLSTEKKRKKRKGTFESRVLEILSDGVPRGTRKIKQELESKFHLKTSSRNVSSQLKHLINKDALNKQAFPEYPMEIRTLYGLPKWFDKGQLKNEYLSVVKKSSASLFDR